MDPVSHVAFGRALALLNGPRDARVVHRGRLAAAALGAIAPDADLVLAPFGWDRYLVAHESLTHSIAGSLVCALLAALIVRLAGRQSAGFSRLLAAAWIGTLFGHVALDLVSGGAVRPFWPLSDARVSLPLVAMADPLLATPLWVFLLASVCWRCHARSLALGTVVTVLLILGVKGISLSSATRLVASRVTGDGLAAFDATWGSWVRWSAFDRSGDEVRSWQVNAWRREVSQQHGRSGPRSAPVVVASRALDTVRDFEAVFDLGFPRIVHDGPRTTVLWSDVRVCGRERCALWFGGTFDAQLRPIEQIVLVGSVRQTRAP